jgi:hypothetical protein
VKQSEAVKHLKDLLFIMQKFRSNAKEAGLVSREDDPMTAVVTELMPWLFDDAKCPIPAIVKILDWESESGILSPLDYYNVMTILYRFLPTLVAAAPILLGDSSFPDKMPGLHEILGGWDSE